MSTWLAISPEWLFPLCFAFSIVSALVPWINGEVLLLSCAALARSPSDLVILVLAASAGQMAGKCGLYWVGRGTVKLQSGRIRVVVNKWRERFQQSPSKLLMLVFVSSAVGIPPFYVITVLAGAFHMKFAPFLGIGACGRLIRFGLLVFIPQFALHMIRAGR
jgi:membrane protein YqaA with SNARE-associated domain